jgi:hypothetical protein
VQALAEAREVALLFPSARLRSAEPLARAEALAHELADVEDVPEAALADVILLVDEAEARRLVDDWTSVYPDRWASLCHTAGDVSAAERELVVGAVAAAIHERMPTPRDVLVELELADLPPGPALALVLPPQFLWSYDEARAAAVVLPDQFDELAAALGRFEHVERLRALAGLVRRELPFGDFPSASEVLLKACAEVERDDAFAREILMVSLMAYARELTLRHGASRN